jgi:hypothetical protein
MKNGNFQYEIYEFWKWHWLSTYMVPIWLIGSRLNDIIKNPFVGSFFEKNILYDLYVVIR